jgi:hypothetical protein
LFPGGFYQVYTIFAVALLLLCPFALRAQQVKDRKWEAGGHYFLLRQTRLEETGQGAGARVGYNLNDFIALEGEANLFRRPGGNRVETQLLGGARGGIRNRRWGLFGKWRPGVVVLPSAAGRRQTFFALDAGGVLEIYPARRLIFRVDASDTRIFVKRGAFAAGGATVNVNDSYSHNLQITAGLGFRF